MVFRQHYVGWGIDLTVKKVSNFYGDYLFMDIKGSYKIVYKQYQLWFSVLTISE